MTNPLFPRSNQHSKQQKQIQQSLDRLKQLSTRTEPQVRQQILKEAQRLQSSLKGKNKDLDRLLSLLANTAQTNLIQTSSRVRNQVESFLKLLSSNKSATRARQALELVLGSKVENLDNPISQVATLVNQLAPQLFSGTTISPEQAGGVQQEKEPSTRQVQANKPETYRGMRLVNNTTVEINTGGFKEQYKIDDPIITGKMVTVHSSNVHSIGFKFNLSNPRKSVLFVRYLQGTAGSKGKGPLYGYANVHPHLFTQFMAANSKGIFVWDELRIRGTVAGAQYQYTLLGVVGDNVPRRAMVVDGVQILKRRTKQVEAHHVDRNSGRKTISSKLQTQRIGKYRPTSDRKNVGNPNRATPNRGR